MIYVALATLWAFLGLLFGFFCLLGHAVVYNVRPNWDFCVGGTIVGMIFVAIVWCYGVLHTNKE